MQVVHSPAPHGKDTHHAGSCSGAPQHFLSARHARSRSRRRPLPPRSLRSSSRWRSRSSSRWRLADLRTPQQHLASCAKADLSQAAQPYAVAMQGATYSAALRTRDITHAHRSSRSPRSRRRSPFSSRWPSRSRSRLRSRPSLCSPSSRSRSLPCPRPRQGIRVYNTGFGSRPGAYQHVSAMKAQLETCHTSTPARVGRIARCNLVTPVLCGIASLARRRTACNQALHPL